MIIIMKLVYSRPNEYGYKTFGNTAPGSTVGNAAPLLVQLQSDVVGSVKEG